MITTSTTRIFDEIVNLNNSMIINNYTTEREENCIKKLIQQKRQLPQPYSTVLSGLKLIIT